MKPYALSEAQREQRRRETALMPKCECGNVARQGQTKCGACLLEDELEAELAAAKEDRLSALDRCNSVDDLKAFIREHLLS